MLKETYFEHDKRLKAERAEKRKKAAPVKKAVPLDRMNKAQHDKVKDILKRVDESNRRGIRAGIETR